MAFIPLPNGAFASIRFTLGTEPCEWGLHAIMDTEPTESDLEDLADICAQWVVDYAAPLQAAAAVHREVYVRSLVAAIAPVYTLTYASPLAGSASGDAMPNNVAACVTKRTGLAGRSARGRTYFCGIPDGQAVGSFLTNDYATAINTAFLNLLTDVNASQWTAVVASFETGKVPRAVGVAYPITVYSLRDQRVDSQRRRLPA